MRFSGPIPGLKECQGVAAEPGAELTRRLTVKEYVRTVADTLGVQISEAALPPDSKTEGFLNTASALTVTFGHVQAYFELADQIVASIADLEALVARHTRCQEVRPACRDQLIQGLGNLLFRRSLTRNEVERVVPVFTQVTDDGGTFVEAAGYVLRRLLQSPQFLYRLEQTGPAERASRYRVLSGSEIAVRLSYMVWGSAPDEALVAAADEGRLQTRDGRASQAQRLLQSDRAHGQLIAYVRDWLYLDRLTRLERSSGRYPEFSPELADAMLEQTTRLAERLWLQERTPMHALFTSRIAPATPELAGIYGLPSQGPGFQTYDTSTLEHRAGALTHPGVLALSGQGETPSIVSRGLYVLENLLCAEIGDPPPGVDTSPVDSEPGRSQRYYSEQRLQNVTCRGCHGQFDPLAYALEPFDGIGRHRTEDEHGNPLRSDGWFFDLDGQMRSYESTADFLSLLSGSNALRQCLVKKVVQYALGRPLLWSDRCALADIWNEVEANGGSYQAAIIAIASHPDFARVNAEAR